MIEIPGNWELAKALAPTDQTQWRRDEEWRQAESKAAELRAQGYTVTIRTSASGGPVIIASGGEA